MARRTTKQDVPDDFEMPVGEIYSALEKGRLK